MTDFVPSSTGSDNDDTLDEAINDFERALNRLDRIIETRAGQLLRQTTQGNGARVSSKRRIIYRGLSDVASSVLNPPGPQRTVFNPHAGKQNRFPASRNQWLTDLAGILQAIGRRNL